MNNKQMIAAICVFIFLGLSFMEGQLFLKETLSLISVLGLFLFIIFVTMSAFSKNKDFVNAFKYGKIMKFIILISLLLIVISGFSKVTGDMLGTGTRVTDAFFSKGILDSVLMGAMLLIFAAFSFWVWKGKD